MASSWNSSYLQSAESGSYRPEGELVQETPDPTRAPLQAAIVAEPGRPRNGEARLARIEFPGMDIESGGDAPALRIQEGRPNQPERQEPQVTPACRREIAAQTT